MTDATPGEIMRRLDDVVKQLIDLASQLRDDRNNAAKLYVTREVHTLAREKDQAAVAEVAKDVVEIQAEAKRAADFRKQVIFGFALAAISTLVTLSVAVSNFLAR